MGLFDLINIVKKIKLNSSYLVFRCINYFNQFFLKAPIPKPYPISCPETRLRSGFQNPTPTRITNLDSIFDSGHIPKFDSSIKFDIFEIFFMFLKTTIWVNLSNKA